MRKIPSSSLAFVPLIAAALFTGACAPTFGPQPSPQPSQSLEVFSGMLSPGETHRYLATLSATTTLQVTLAGALVPGTPPRSIQPTLRIGVAKYDAVNGVCEEEGAVQVETAPRLTAALQRWLEPAIYCVSVTDPGTLPEPAVVTLRVAHPAVLVAAGEPGTHTFSSTITEQGSAIRTFRVTQSGQVNITLRNLTQGAIEAALGIGVLSYDGSGCKLTNVVTTVPGPSPQISLRADAGDYCASVADIGKFIGHQTFEMVIQHP